MDTNCYYSNDVHIRKQNQKAAARQRLLYHTRYSIAPIIKDILHQFMFHDIFQYTKHLYISVNLIPIHLLKLLKSHHQLQLTEQKTITNQYGKL